MKRASLMVLLIAFAFALPAAAAGPANTAPAVQAPAVAVSGAQVSATPHVAPVPSTSDAATLIKSGLPQAPLVEATTCTRTVLCYDGTYVTCTGSVCDWEPRCYVWCDTTGYTLCKSPCA